METRLSPLDDHARDLARSVAAGELSNTEAVGSILAAAMDRGVISQQIAQAHGSALSRLRHESDEFVDAATFMLVGYALPDGKDSPLDVTRFAEDDSSATGWIRRTVASFRASRIEREIRHVRHMAYLEDEVFPEPASEDPAVFPVDVPDHDEMSEAARDKRKDGEALLFIHASVLYDLLGGPALRWWALSDAERTRVLAVLDEDPSLPRRALTGAEAEDEADLVCELWEDWSDEQIAEATAKSSSDRDIVGLLTRAAVTPFPKPPPGNRGRDERALRRRIQAGLGLSRDFSDRLFDGFMGSKVALHCDKDRRRAPLDPTAFVERVASASSFPATLFAASSASGVPHDDLLSGLVRIVLDHVPVLDPRHFTPTGWSFSGESPHGNPTRRPLDKK